LFRNHCTYGWTLHAYLYTSRSCPQKGNWNEYVDRCHNPSLGSRLKQRLTRLWAKRGSQGVKESVREWTFTLPRELLPCKLESWWTLECLENDCRGQNPMDWEVLYAIGKLLKLRCLKWPRMTHLDI